MTDNRISAEDYDRLRMMGNPMQTGWDLSPDDQKAIRAVVAEVDREHGQMLKYRARCRTAAQMLIEVIGADGQENLDRTAQRAAMKIRKLRDCVVEMAQEVRRIAVDQVGEESVDWPRSD